MRKQKTYFIYKHQNKADSLEAALRQFGWKVDRSLRNTAAAFFDIDIMNRVELFNQLHQHDIRLFVYPHAARANIVYAWKEHRPHPFTTAHFVSAIGHKEIMESIGYPHPIHVTGWSYCEKRKFEPSRQVRNVLFGPLHPNANGWLHEVDKDTNREALDRLKQASKEMGFKITMRHIHNLEENGFACEEDPEITYIHGRPDNSFEEIDSADLVVGTQTFAYLAVARGKPTLMMNEWIAPKAGNCKDSFAFIDGWDSFKHLMMYPLDINTASDVPALIQRAAGTDVDIEEWRRRQIGAPFDPKLFTDIVKSYFPEGLR